MSNKEIHRCLKRYIVSELYPLLLTDLADSMCPRLTYEYQWVNRKTLGFAEGGTAAGAALCEAPYGDVQNCRCACLLQRASIASNIQLCLLRGV
jgi:hypothetical protein